MTIYTATIGDMRPEDGWTSQPGEDEDSFRERVYAEASPYLPGLSISEVEISTPWKVIGTGKVETTVEDLKSLWPELVAYDASGFEVDPEDPTSWDSELILFWSCEEDSQNDDGGLAVAKAIRG